MGRGRPGLAHVVAADADRVPARQLFGAELEDVGHEPHGRPRREDVGAAGDVLLENVVLGGAADLGSGDTLLFSRRHVQRQKDAGGRVDRHRGADGPERQAVEKDLHVGQRADRHADPPDLALGLGGVGVVTHLGRQIEGHRKAGLALLQQVAKAAVGVGGSRESGVLAHCP